MKLIVDNNLNLYMKFRSLRICALLLATVFFCLPIVAQEKKEIWLPTTLIEISPEIAAEWHRINGKIEGGVRDHEVMEAAQSRFVEWLERSGNLLEVTFEEAQTKLLKELQLVDKKLDIAIRTDDLLNWPESKIVVEIAPAKISLPNLQEILVIESPSGPSNVAARVIESNVSKADISIPRPKKQIPDWMVVVIMLFTASSGIAGWRLYPQFFQARVDGYALSPWERFKKRSVFTFVWMIVTFIGSAYLVPEIVGALTAK